MTGMMETRLIGGHARGVEQQEGSAGSCRSAPWARLRTPSPDWRPGNYDWPAAATYPHAATYPQLPQLSECSSAPFPPPIPEPLERPRAQTYFHSQRRPEEQAPFPLPPPEPLERPRAQIYFHSQRCP